MSHQNLMLDPLHNLDVAQALFMLSNPKTYNHFIGNPSSQYSRSSYSNSSWGSSSTFCSDASYSPTVFNSSTQLQSVDPSISHCAQLSGHINTDYPSYTASSPFYAPQRTFTDFQDSHQTLGLNRPGSGDIYSISSPVLSEISHRQAPNSAPASIGRGVAWNSPQTENPHQRAETDILPETFGWSPLSADSQYSSWSDSPSSTSSTDTGVQYNYSLEVSSAVPPKPRSAAALPLRHVSPVSTSSSPPESRQASMDSPAPTGKSCSHCHATSTPLWRREPNTLKPLCNACGLYLSQRNKHRPQELIDADAADDSDTSDSDGSGPECSHCHTHHTSVWRRSKTGAQLCNACGVYSRLRGRDRPLSLKRNKIKPRSKHTPPSPTTPL